ncbi:VanZ family protein [Collinsella tanakaei]|nr:VanZ family protein [Collinsella tanakaei]
MPPTRDSSAAGGCVNRRKVVGIILLLGFVVSLFAVFFLTEQSAQDTTSLSNGIVQVILCVLVIFQIEPTGIDPWLISWFVRKLAHTVEFFVIGMFAAATCIAWTKQGGVHRAFVRATFLSVASSLFDQFHKLFVPGREFDYLDLAFDALGYLIAIRLVRMLSEKAIARSRHKA